MTIEIFVGTTICLILLLMLVYGRMKYYKAHAEAKMYHIKELQYQLMILNFINNDKATRYAETNFS